MTTTSETPDEPQSNRATPLSLLKKIIYGIWHFHRRLVLSLIILLAVILVVLRSVAWFLEENPHIVKAYVESYLDIPVAFEQIHVQINPFFPSVSMKNFVIKDKLDDKNHLDFSWARIRLNLPLSVFRGQGIIDTLTLEGFNTVVRRNKEGAIVIAGIQLPDAQEKVPNTAKFQAAYLQLFQQTKIIINNSQVVFIDDMNEYPSVFVSDINLVMANNNKRHQITLRAGLNKSETHLDFRFDFNGEIDDITNWDGKIYTAIDKLNHQTVLKLLEQEIIQIENYQINDIETGVKVWTKIERGCLQSIKGELSVKNAHLKRVDTEQAIRFDHLNAHFTLERYGDVDSVADIKASNWAIDLYDINLNIDSRPISNKQISLRYQENSDFQSPERLGNPGLQIFVNELDISQFSHVISFFSPMDFNKKVYQILKPRGQVENIIASIQLKSLDMPVDITHYQVQAKIKGFSSNAFLSFPKIRNFSSQVIFNETMGRATIDSHDMKLHIKSLFRDSWPITDLSGEVYWQKEDEDWLLGAENVQVKNPHLNANADLKLWINNNGQTLMDLTGFYHDANVKYTSYYLPVTIMSDGLVKWLDDAIVSGFGTDGGVVYRGNLSEFPYPQPTGIMDIVFNASDVVLEFEKGWPELTDINAQVQFTEQGMWVESSHSKIFSATSENTRVDIEHYLEPVLRIKGDLNSTIDDSVKFLQQSQLVSNDVLEIIDARDNIGLHLDLSLPLEAGEPDSIVKIRLNNADYFPPGFERKTGLVSNLKGEVIVHNQAIDAKKLTANIMGLPAKVTINTAKLSPNSKKDPDVKVVIDSSVSIQQLKKYQLFPASLSYLTDQISGISKVNLAIDLPNDQRPLSLDISSNLQGIESRLPSPFNKKTNANSPLKINFSENQSVKKASKLEKTARMKLDFADIFSLAILLDNSTDELELLRGNVHLGTGPSRLPKNNVLKISGSLTKLPIEQWQKVFSSQHSGKHNIKSYSKKAFIPIELAMSQLAFPKLKAEKRTDKNAGKPPSTTMKTSSFLTPEYFPLINGRIDSVKLGEAELGKFTIRSSRVEQGIVFDAFSLEGDLMAFSGKGKWHQWSKIPKVDMEGELQVPSLEKFLTQLGYDQLIRNGEARVSGYVSWPGGLADFSTQNAQGKISLSVKNGTYLEGQPGTAGRLLGLLNMNALARRISLDFTDVSRRGYEFDSIKGDFRINEGNANTDNLRIRAPSTKILLKGRTGLVAEDFDQRVTVIPEVSATLPLAGAAVAGPAGAAVVWVGQRLIGERINQMTAFGYTVKGSWQEPIIERDRANKNALKDVKKAFGEDESIDNDVLKPEFDIDDADLP